jgi:hypothetical protein
MVKTVYSSQKPFREDYERQTKVMQDHIRQFNINKEKIANRTIYKCDNRGGTLEPNDPMYFMPIQAGILGPKTP